MRLEALEEPSNDEIAAAQERPHFGYASADCRNGQRANRELRSIRCRPRSPTSRQKRTVLHPSRLLAKSGATLPGSDVGLFSALRGLWSQ